MQKRSLSHLPNLGLGALGALALSALALPACSGSSPVPEGDDVGQTAQALTQCVTIQRGTFGNVEDATIANGITAPDWSPGALHAGGGFEALVKFDVSSLPAGAVVTSATLSLTTASTVANYPLWARPATAAWTEGTVTFAGFNQQISNKSSGYMTPSAVNTTQTLTVKPATVQAWLDGTTPNHGFVLETMISAPAAWKETVFVSSESGSAALRPALQVCYTPIDYCAPAPCLNGAACTSGNTGYTCACAPGYTGQNCQTNIDDCAGSPCQNGGSCTDGVNGYTCSCAAGYTGINCQTDIDECAGNPCQNGGVCTDHVNAYSCSCAAGFTGQNCQIDIDDCAGNPCQNGGSCADGVNGYTCSCAAGYTGNNCQTNIDDCVGNACQNGSTCVDGIAAYTCACAPGFTGALCQINVDDCAGNPCQNGGSCTDGVGGYTCSCAAGYTGSNCEIDINDCAGNPCQNGGSCVDGVNAYTCQCPSGYSGVNCEIPNGVTCPCAADPLWGQALASPDANPAWAYVTSYYASGYWLDTAHDFYAANNHDGTGYCGVDDYSQGQSVYLDTTDAEGQACVDQIADWYNAPCAGNPCQNGGVCGPIANGGYSCHCPLGTSGPTCDTCLTDGNSCGGQAPCGCGLICDGTACVEPVCNFYGDWVSGTVRLESFATSVDGTWLDGFRIPFYGSLLGNGCAVYMTFPDDASYQGTLGNNGCRIQWSYPNQPGTTDPNNFWIKDNCVP